MAYRFHEPINIDEINLTYYCRKCKQKVRGIPLTEPHFHLNGMGDTRAWLICRCPTKMCELSFVIYDKLNDHIQSVYPYPTFDANDYHQSIPLKVREDIAEAERCFYSDAYKASVTMYRRAIQNIAVDKIQINNISNKSLSSQIDILFSDGYITKDLKETAHEIRHLGNFGAHPSTDNLDDINKEDVDLISQLVFDLIRTIYITPFQTAELKTKRTNRQNE